MALPIRKYVKRALAAVVLLAALGWASDWLVLRYKVAHDGGFDDVEVRYRFAVHLKNRRIEQRNEQPQMVECVESLFSHYAESPCWYLKRHANQAEDLDSGPWHFWGDDRP